MTETTHDKVQEKLYDYIEDAHALEQAAVDSLESMVDSIGGSELHGLLERQRQVSRLHAERLAGRLELLGRDTSMRKRLEGMAVTLMKSVSDAVRTDAPGPDSPGRAGRIYPIWTQPPTTVRKDRAAPSTRRAP